MERKADVVKLSSDIKKNKEAIETLKSSVPTDSSNNIIKVNELETKLGNLKTKQELLESNIAQLNVTHQANVNLTMQTKNRQMEINTMIQELRDFTAANDNKCFTLKEKYDALFKISESHRSIIQLYTSTKTITAGEKFKFNFGYDFYRFHEDALIKTMVIYRPRNFEYKIEIKPNSLSKSGEIILDSKQSFRNIPDRHLSDADVISETMIFSNNTLSIISQTDYSSEDAIPLFIELYLQVLN